MSSEERPMLRSGKFYNIWEIIPGFLLGLIPTLEHHTAKWTEMPILPWAPPRSIARWKCHISELELPEPENTVKHLGQAAHCPRNPPLLHQCFSLSSHGGPWQWPFGELISKKEDTFGSGLSTRVHANSRLLCPTAPHGCCLKAYSEGDSPNGCTWSFISRGKGRGPRLENMWIFGQ